MTTQRLLPANPWQTDPEVLDEGLLAHLRETAQALFDVFDCSSQGPPQHVILTGAPASGRSHVAATAIRRATHRFHFSPLVALTGRAGPFPGPEGILERYLRQANTANPLSVQLHHNAEERPLVNGLAAASGLPRCGASGVIVLDSVEDIAPSWSAGVFCEFLDTLKKWNVHLLMICRENPVPAAIAELMRQGRLRQVRMPAPGPLPEALWNAATGSGSPSPAVQTIARLCGARLDFRALLRPLEDVSSSEVFADDFLHLFEVCLAPRIGRIMDSLAPQQRYIAAELSGMPGTISVRDLAGKTGITSQTASRQLYELQNAGIVTKTAVGRESWYEISLPILRYYFSLDGCEAANVQGIVRLLYDWQVPAEPRQLAATKPETSVPYYTAALGSLDAMLAKNPRNERALWFKSAALIELDRCSEALDALVQFLDAAPAASPVRRHAAADLFPLFLKRPDNFDRFARAWTKTPFELAYGATRWVRETRPRTREAAAAVHAQTCYLDHAAGGMPGIAVPARLAQAAVHRVQDSKNPLLTLPRELRTLLATP